MNSTSKYCFNALFVFVILFCSTSRNYCSSKDASLSKSTCMKIIEGLEQFINSPASWKNSIDEVITAVKADASYATNKAAQALVESLEAAKKAVNKNSLKACLNKYESYLEGIVWAECTMNRSLKIKWGFKGALKKIVL